MLIIMEAKFIKSVLFLFEVDYFNENYIGQNAQQKSKALSPCWVFIFINQRRCSQVDILWSFSPIKCFLCFLLSRLFSLNCCFIDWMKAFIFHLKKTVECTTRCVHFHYLSLGLCLIRIVLHLPIILCDFFFFVCLARKVSVNKFAVFFFSSFNSIQKVVYRQ